MDFTYESEYTVFRHRYGRSSQERNQWRGKYDQCGIEVQCEGKSKLYLDYELESMPEVRKRQNIRALQPDTEALAPKIPDHITSFLVQNVLSHNLSGRPYQVAVTHPESSFDSLRNRGIEKLPGTEKYLSSAEPLETPAELENKGTTQLLPKAG